MRVSTPSRSLATGRSTAVRSAGAGSFAPKTARADTNERASAAVSLTAASGLVGVDALLAAQAVEDAVERGPRQLALARADAVLDALDAVQLAVLDGAHGAGPALIKLAAASARPKTQTQDAGLDALLNMVDVRAAVELAKRQARGG